MLSKTITITTAALIFGSVALAQASQDMQTPTGGQMNQGSQREIQGQRAMPVADQQMTEQQRAAQRSMQQTDAQNSDARVAAENTARQNQEMAQNRSATEQRNYRAGERG